MPCEFFVTLRTPEGDEPLVDLLSFDTLELAYLDACTAIPGAAAELLRGRRQPFDCAFLISDRDGRLLMEVPFTETLAAPGIVLAAAGPRIDAQRPRTSLNDERARLQRLTVEARVQQARARAAISASASLLRRSAPSERAR